MIHIDTLAARFPSDWPAPRVLCAGVFDGVHLAHRILVRRAIEAARPHGTSIVFTFANHPLAVLAPPYAPRQITPPAHKRALLEALGIDALVMPPFDSDIAMTTAQAFVEDILVDRFRIDRIVVGFDFRFGVQGAGDAELLQRLGSQHGFQVEVVAPVRENEWVVSSTRIRELIDEGRMRDAARLLGRHHEVEGRVVRGYGRGAQLGYPTANLDIPPDRALPPSGVYAVFVRVGESPYGGMMNIGYNPTFEGTRYSPEVFLFDYEGEEIYDQTVSVLFVQRIREERKFPNAQQLTERLAVDETLARALLQSHPPDFA